MFERNIVLNFIFSFFYIFEILGGFIIRGFYFFMYGMVIINLFYKEYFFFVVNIIYILIRGK